MPAIGNRLASLLDQGGVAYELIHHRPDQTALRTAVDTRTPRAEFAKSVLLVIDGRLVLVVVAADRKIDLGKISAAYRAREVELADEDELAELCPDCEVGAEPPFGNLYGVPVVLDADICVNPFITFNAGTHEDAIRMKVIDFLRLAQPRVMDLAA